MLRLLFCQQEALFKIDPELGEDTVASAVVGGDFLTSPATRSKFSQIFVDSIGSVSTEEASFL